MQYIWEPTDMQPGRRVVAHNNTESYIIGYDPSRAKIDGNLCLVSLRDGSIISGRHTVHSLAAFFNSTTVKPTECHEPTDQGLPK